MLLQTGKYNLYTHKIWTLIKNKSGTFSRDSQLEVYGNDHTQSFSHFIRYSSGFWLPSVVFPLLPALNNQLQLASKKNQPQKDFRGRELCQNLFTYIDLFYENIAIVCLY